MFLTALLAILLVTSLVMVVLLLLPQHDPPTRGDRVPALGIALLLFLTLLAIVGGFAAFS